MLKVKGMLRDLFRFDSIDPELEEELMLSLCNKPIINEDGNTIGFINSVDLDFGTWDGMLYEECITNTILNGKQVQSISIIGR